MVPPPPPPPPKIAHSLVWEGLGEDGTPDPAVGRTTKNGEPLIHWKERVLLAGFAQVLEKAQSVEAAAVAAKGPAGCQVAARPDILALAKAAGYGDWPRKLLPERAIVAALEKGSKGTKGSLSPIPADL